MARPTFEQRTGISLATIVAIRAGFCFCVHRLGDPRHATHSTARRAAAIDERSRRTTKYFWRSHSCTTRRNSRSQRPSPRTDHSLRQSVRCSGRNFRSVGLCMAGRPHSAAQRRRSLSSNCRQRGQAIRVDSTSHQRCASCDNSGIKSPQNHMGLAPRISTAISSRQFCLACARNPQHR